MLDSEHVITDLSLRRESLASDFAGCFLHRQLQALLAMGTIGPHRCSLQRQHSTSSAYSVVRCHRSAEQERSLERDSHRLTLIEVSKRTLRRSSDF